MTIPAPEELDPEEQLALVYAPATDGARLTLLLAFDHRMNGILRSASEPMLAQIRLAWWREQLDALDAGKAPPAEPLLERIAVQPDSRAAIRSLIDHWDDILLDPEQLAEQADKGRAEIILGPGATLGAVTGMTGWALLSRGERERGAATLKTGLANKWPRAFRAQRILARIALMDINGVQKPLGHPSRVARIAWWGLTGR